MPMSMLLNWWQPGNKGMTSIIHLQFQKGTSNSTVSYITFLWKELQLWKCWEHVQLHGTHTSSIPTLETKELWPGLSPDLGFFQRSVIPGAHNEIKGSWWYWQDQGMYKLCLSGTFLHREIPNQTVCGTCTILSANAVGDYSPKLWG